MLQVIGAGVGRTGTVSLKEALERLTGTRCYHMIEALQRPPDIDTWHRAVLGDPPDWKSFFAEYGACVDFPAAVFWRELTEVFPDAIVLLSVRSDSETWWKSASQTI